MQSNVDANAFILEYLPTQKLLSLGTSDGSKNLWAANVYFANDDQLCLYFMSGAETLHVQNIQKNNSVSFTVAASEQPPEGGKIGVQGTGIVTQVTEINELRQLLSIWNTKFFVKPAPPLESIQDNSPFYKITPTRVKLFHTGLDPSKTEHEIELA